MSVDAVGLLAHPALVMMAGGLVLLALRGVLRDTGALAVPLAALGALWAFPEGAAISVRWLGYDLVPLRVDGLARIFGSAFAVAALAAALFGLRQPERRETPVAFIYAGCALGTVFAGDLLTLFAFWESMAFLAALVVWLGGPPARGPARRYIILHVLGGVLLMAGIAGQVAASGSAAFGAIRLEGVAAWLILAGFLLNVAAWPLSAWLPDAYPAATWSGTVFLSIFTTKAAVLALVRGFAGAEVLVLIGLAMIVYGTLYASREGDIRRLLAYALVAQLGFMVAAVGVGSPLAVEGAVAQAVAGIFYQALLFMAAGAVVAVTGRARMADLGGLWHRMPITAACAAVGAAAIAAFPLTSGYVAKSMVTGALAGEGFVVAWAVATAAAAAVVLHAGLRLPWAVFFAGRSALPAADPPWAMCAAMILLAAISVGLGVFPSVIGSVLPSLAEAAPYAPSHVAGQAQLLAFAAMGFVLLRRFVGTGRTQTLDVDWLWRRAGPRLWRGMAVAAERFGAALSAQWAAAGERIARSLRRHHGPHGVLARTWPTGSMALWAVFLLGAYLTFYYL